MACSGSLEQGTQPPRSYRLFGFEVSKSKVYSSIIEAGGVMGATPQKYISCLFVVAPQKL